MEQEGFVAWLRNHPRKPWSLCVSYMHQGKDCALYPDLLVYRHVRGKVRLRLLDPHDPKLHDAAEKAVGLARYAEKPGDFFHGIELIALDKNGEIKRLDVTKEAVREKVKAVLDTAHLAKLFKEQP